MSSPVIYRDWSRERVGRFFGLSGGQLAVAVCSGVPSLIAMGARMWFAAIAWLPVWALIAALVAVPIRGRPAARWLIDWGLAQVGAVLGMSWFESRAAASAGAGAASGDPDLPGVASGIRIHDGPSYASGINRPAIIADTNSHTWAVTARISHPGLGLASTEERGRFGAALSQLCESTARSALVDVVAIQIRAIPDDGAERAAWEEKHHRTDVHPAVLLNERQVGQRMSLAAIRQEAFLTIRVTDAAIKAQAKESGRGLEGKARVLHTIMREVEDRLRGPIGAKEVTWLESAGLAEAVRTGYAPGDRQVLVGARLSGPPGSADGGGVAATMPWPAAGPTVAPPPQPRSYTHGAYTSITCAVLLPEQGAVMGALAPVYVPQTGGERRSVTYFYDTVPPQAADRTVGRDKFSAEMGGEMRTKLGFATRAKHKRDRGRVEGQDEKLARGRMLVRTAVVAASTIPSDWSAAEYGRRLEGSIRSAGFAALRLDLAQDSGFVAACLPLGIGMPARRRTR